LGERVLSLAHHVIKTVESLALVAASQHGTSPADRPDRKVSPLDPGWW